MPLPDADSPKSSNVYIQLSSKQLGSLDKASFDLVQDPVFLNSASEDELRRINLVGQATNMQSQSGPIPGTAEGISVTATDAGTVVAYKPNEGEVYQLIGASVGVKYTGQSSVLLQLRDDSTSVSIELSDSTAQGEPFPENAFISPIYITKELFLQCTFVGSGSGGTGDVRIGVIRVR